ncbi:hypothetical protein BCV70DRAFT_50763 [Testicularia cyperi]|uniref:Uncharacterized protein n=1 Tax=Testicularia cyperi TaxID=1882483 RepID=A0A317XGP5_9BASI|nr:hypothetical protein BCV70DRAFT_50763 [Testicularia cyperi]
MRLCLCALAHAHAYLISRRCTRNALVLTTRCWFPGRLSPLPVSLTVLVHTLLPDHSDELLRMIRCWLVQVQHCIVLYCSAVSHCFGPERVTVDSFPTLPQSPPANPWSLTQFLSRAQPQTSHSDPPLCVPCSGSGRFLESVFWPVQRSVPASTMDIDRPIHQVKPSRSRGGEARDPRCQLSMANARGVSLLVVDGLDSTKKKAVR